MIKYRCIRWQRGHWIIFQTCMLICILISTGIVRGQEISPIQPHNIKWSPDGRQIAVGYQNGQVNIYNTLDSSTILSIEAHNALASTLAWSPDGNLLATGGGFPDNSLRVWNVTTGEMVYEYLDLGVDILAIVWKPDGTQIVASAAEPFNRQHSDIVVERNTWQESPIRLGAVSDIAWSPDLTEIVITRISDIRLIDATSFEMLNQYVLPSTETNLQYQPVGVIWHPDGGSFAVAMGNGRVSLYEVGNLDPIFTFVANEYAGDDRFIGWVHALHFDASGQTLTGMSGDGVIRTWNVQTETLVAEQVGNLNYAADFSPYGAQIALGIAPETSEITIGSSDTMVVIRTLAGGTVQIVVPAPSLERLQAIAEACNAPTTIEQSLTANIQADRLAEFVAEVESLPDDMIPPACRVDLLAVAEALQTLEQE